MILKLTPQLTELLGPLTCSVTYLEEPTVTTWKSIS